MYTIRGHTSLKPLILSKKYDIEKKIIWINTAVEEKNNVVKLEPAKL